MIIRGSTHLVREPRPCRDAVVRRRHRKLKKYQKIKAGIRRARKNNTDKMTEAENRGKRRLQKRERRLAEARAKAQATKSTLKKTILNAQIWALKIEGRWDTGGKKKIKAKKVGQL